MQITKIHVELSDGAREAIAKQKDPMVIYGVIAFCSIVDSDEFVIDEIKVIHSNGNIHISMPTQKINFKRICGHKNTYDHNYCCKCGQKLTDMPWEGGKTHMDMCHPINRECRKKITDAVLDALKEEITKHKDYSSSS